MNKTIKLSIAALSLISTLNAKDIKLDTITISSASKTSQSITDTTSNVSVITKEEIEEKNFSTVAEALNTVSGINFTNNGGLGKATSVLVRGFDSKRVLVLIDGIRYNDAAGISGAPFAHLMLEDVEQIELVKGAQSGIWGADATAGVINIITSPAKPGLHASLLAEYGSFKTSKLGISASYKNDDYYLKVSSKKIDTDGFSAQAPRDTDLDNYEDDGYENITTTLKLGFNINETNKIDISHTMIDAKSYFDAYNDANAKNYSKTKDSFSQINFNHIDSFNEVDIYAKLSVFDRNYPLGWTKEFDGEVGEYGIKSTISYNEKDFLVAGIDYKTFEHKNGLARKYNNKAFFLTNSNEFDFNGKTIISESIRFDDYNKFDDKLTAKVGIKHFCNNVDDLILSANIGSAYNVPTLYNLYDPTYGNEDLKPESTLSYDLTLAYKDIQITYFHSKTKDMIDYFDPDEWGGPLPGKYYNIAGETKLKGIEIEYKTEIYDDILIAAYYTYLDAKNNDKEKLSRRPKDTIKLSVDYYGISNLHLGMFGEYIGERYDNDNSQGQQTGKYTVANLVANYDINKNFSVYAKVDNLFDTYYQVVDGFASSPLSAYAGIKAKF